MFIISVAEIMATGIDSCRVLLGVLSGAIVPKPKHGKGITQMKVSIPKRALESLSTEALGALVKMISTGADPTQAHIREVTGYGVNKARKIQHELIAHSFVERSQLKDGSGRYSRGETSLCV